MSDPQPEPEPTKFGPLAQEVFRTAIGLRQACEDYDSKRIRGVDVKEVDATKTDAQVEDLLKKRVKPAIQAHKATLKALTGAAKAELDSTI